MIDVFDLWQQFKGAVNIEQGGSVATSLFVDWGHEISLSLYEEKFAAWAKSQKIIDDLSRPFLKSVNIQVKDVPGANYGVIKMPNDYGHFSSLRYFAKEKKAVPLPGLKLYDCNGEEYTSQSCPNFLNEDLWEIMQSAQQAKEVEQGITATDLYDEFPIDKVDDDRWGACLQHRFLKPTPSDPKATDLDTGLKIAPAGIGIVVLGYLRRPVRPTFPLKSVPGDPLTGEGDVLVYDKDKAVPLDWSELVLNEFIVRLEKKYGKYVRESFFYEAAENDRKQNV